MVQILLVEFCEPKPPNVGFRKKKKKKDLLHRKIKVVHVPPGTITSSHAIDSTGNSFLFGSCPASVHLKVDATLLKADSCIDVATFVVGNGFI